jgi:hypothetical protein
VSPVFFLKRAIVFPSDIEKLLILSALQFGALGLKPGIMKFVTREGF